MIKELTSLCALLLWPTVAATQSPTERGPDYRRELENGAVTVLHPDAATHPHATSAPGSSSAARR